MSLYQALTKQLNLISTKRAAVKVYFWLQGVQNLRASNKIRFSPVLIAYNIRIKVPDGVCDHT